MLKEVLVATVASTAANREELIPSRNLDLKSVTKGAVNIVAK